MSHAQEQKDERIRSHYLEHGLFVTATRFGVSERTVLRATKRAKDRAYMKSLPELGVMP